MRFFQDGSARASTLRSDRGFSLIELLIVILILGVLAGIVAFAVGGFSNAGEEEACETDKKTLITALEAFKASPRRAEEGGDYKYKGYPNSQDRLVEAQLILAPSKKWNFSPNLGSLVDVPNPPDVDSDDVIQIEVPKGTSVGTTPLYDSYAALTPVSGSGC
ncbi:MAG: prepilin-type N-terminal cleavage/methylation domain-containing protein [Acidimicrobiia bacterium]|nr:prepilin-type N-terminal cleavage/methylation domain-containing protein [Acidimicrobiia bacterium]